MTVRGFFLARRCADPDFFNSLPSRWPALPDMPDKAADMAAHLLAGGRLAGPEHDRHGPARRGVVNVDRQEAVGVVIGVEQRQLLAAVDLVAGVVDVERDARR